MKPITEMSREEAIEALQLALERIRILTDDLKTSVDDWDRQRVRAEQLETELVRVGDQDVIRNTLRGMRERISVLEKRMAWRAVMTFVRRVDEEWIVPALGRHYSADAEGKPYCYSDDPRFTKDESPSGLYPAVVVPKEVVGKVIAIRPLEIGEGERL